jgi:hypothetical protein
LFFPLEAKKQPYRKDKALIDEIRGSFTLLYYQNRILQKCCRKTGVWMGNNKRKRLSQENLQLGEKNEKRKSNHLASRWTMNVRRRQAPQFAKRAVKIVY